MEKRGSKERHCRGGKERMRKGRNGTDDMIGRESNGEVDVEIT